MVIKTHDQDGPRGSQELSEDFSFASPCTLQQVVRDGRQVSSGIGGRILVVDDDADFRSLLLSGLRCRGYECRGAEHGLAAISSLVLHPVGLVLTDLSMPVMDGLELIRRMATTPSLSATPAILLTSSLTLDICLRALSVGAKAALSKLDPFMVLLDTIRQFLPDSHCRAV